MIDLFRAHPEAILLGLVFVALLSGCAIVLIHEFCRKDFQSYLPPMEPRRKPRYRHP